MATGLKAASLSASSRKHDDRLLSPSSESDLRWATEIIPFACLYASFGATLGLIGSGAPLVFRAHGAPLAEIGLIQTIFLPSGLTFLWAGALDRIRLPFLGHRIGWIALMQGATIALLLALAWGIGGPISLLFAMAMATAFAAATMDIALEAYVVETVPPVRRAAVTTAKLVGSALGGMLGVGLVTIAPVPLSAALLAVAGLDALWLYPILRLRETARPRPTAMATSAWHRLPTVLRRALILGFYFAASTMLSDSDSLVLLDLHVALPVVGLLTGTVAKTIQIAMTLAAGALAIRFAADRLVLAMASGVALGGLLMLAATTFVSPAVGIAGMLLNATCGAALGVPVFAMIYRWAEGDHAAADYALLFGAAFLAALPARIGATALADWLGWPAYFALCVPLYVVAFATLTIAMRRTRLDDAA